MNQPKEIEYQFVPDLVEWIEITDEDYYPLPSEEVDLCTL